MIKLNRVNNLNLNHNIMYVIHILIYHFILLKMFYKNINTMKYLY